MCFIIKRVSLFFDEKKLVIYLSCRFYVGYLLNDLIWFFYFLFIGVLFISFIIKRSRNDFINIIVDIYKMCSYMM